MNEYLLRTSLNRMRNIKSGLKYQILNLKEWINQDVYFLC